MQDDVPQDDVPRDAVPAAGATGHGDAGDPPPSDWLPRPEQAVEGQAAGDVVPVVRFGPFAKLFGGLFGFAFAAMMVTTIVTVGIWPGEAKLTAPLLCDADHPDPFVVSDTYTSGGETTTNFTLYCVGERGQARDIGFFRPMAVLFVAHFVGLVLLLVVPPWLGGVFRLGRSRPRPPTPPEDVVMPDILAER